MRLLFVSSTTVGGSGRSQRELMARLVALGHEARLLVDDDRGAPLTRWWYDQLSDLSVRLTDRAVGGLVRWLLERPGRRTGTARLDGLEHVTSPIPQNALPAVIERFQPDVVVGNSLERWQWRQLYRICRDHDVPTILYIREEESLDHLRTDTRPDVVVANAESLAEAVRRIGSDCEFIPSVIDVSVTRTDSTRRVALAINPIESRGVDIVWEVAARLPDIPFVLQESWPLTPEQLEAVERNGAGLPNVEFRRARPPGPELYGDTRVLLVPYRVDNRPRVITEAQSNAIPVVAADVPALAEAIGAGGVTVGIDDIDEWVAVLQRVWTDDRLYVELCDRAEAHAGRAETAPRLIAERFLGVVEQVLGSTGD